MSQNVAVAGLGSMGYGIAQSCRRAGIDTLGMDLNPARGAARVADATPPQIGAGAIVLSGSCSAMARAQVARYMQDAPSYRLDPLVLARDGVGPALDWLAAQSPEASPIVCAIAEPEDVRAAQSELRTARAGKVVEAALVKLAIAARNRGTRSFVVAGGETSGAVTQALGVARLDVSAEIAPGVPWTFCKSGGHQIALALKSGNFGTRDFFEAALAKLES